MPTLDLNITEMRREILERQHEAMRPFQEELRKLDIIEELMQQNQAQPMPEGERLQKLYAADTAAASRVKPNGHAEPKEFSRLKRYAKLTQRESVIQILKDEPHLNARVITERMIAGGFPFSSTKPYASMTQVLGDMAKDGEVLVQKPVTRVGGAQNRYAVNPDAPATERRHNRPRALTKAAL